MQTCERVLKTLLLTSVAALGISSAAAEVVLDGTLGRADALPGPDFRIPAAVGQQRGGNLFHSFRSFNLSHPESATFTGPAGIANVISRVTGGQPSNIDGVLRSEVPNADFWFLNPAGVVFGPNARLDVPASFHVSTADEIRFPDGKTFSATEPEGSMLSVAPPEAFGFLGRKPATITMSGSNLTVSPEKSISLVGGDVRITGGTLAAADLEAFGAPGGQVSLISVASPGEVRPAEGTVAADRLGSVAVSDSSRVEASGIGGGAIRIRGGEFTLTNSDIFADNTGAKDSTGGVDVRAGTITIRGGVIAADAYNEGKGGTVTVNAREIHLSHGGFLQALTQEGSTGAGGSVTVDAQNALTLTDRGVISTEAFGAGPGGDIVIRAPGRMSVDNSFIGASSGSGTPETADSGSVTIDAGRLDFINDGRIFNGTSGAGDGGTITITADVITADIGTDPTPNHTGISAATQRGSSGRGGDVSVTAREITLVNGSEITSSTRGEGTGGAIVVGVSEQLVLNNGFIGADTAGPAPGGALSVNAGELIFLNEGRIFNGTSGAGDGGTITVTADTLVADATALDHTPRFHTGISASANEGSSGQGGDVTINARQITLQNGGLLSTETYGLGAGGSIVINAGEQLIVTSGGVISAETFDKGPGGSITIQQTPHLLLNNGFIGANSREGSAETADAGHVTIEAGRLEFVNEGRVFNGTDGAGDGGDIMVTADTILADATALDHIPRFHTGISASANEGSSGAGGDVTVEAREIRLVNGGEISADTESMGAGGAIAVTANNLLEVRTGGSIDSSTSGAGDAGPVTVTAERLEIADQGTIGTETSSGGRGGALVLNIGHLNMSDGGRASTAAAATGDGGSLRITARDGVTIAGAGSGLFASSESTRADSGQGGTIRLSAPTLLLADGAAVTTRRAGGLSGESNLEGSSLLSGSILIEEVETLQMSGGSSISAETARADAGDIEMQVGRLIDLRDSEVTTSVAGGQGAGGNIFIDPRFFILDNSRIIANAREGAGGNIHIAADFIFRSPESVIDASSEFGISGTVAIAATELDVTSSVVALPAAFLDPTPLRARCGGRGDGGTGSFTGIGRGGTGIAPDAPLPGFYSDLVEPSAATASEPPSLLTPPETSTATASAWLTRCGKK